MLYWRNALWREDVRQTGEKNSAKTMVSAGGSLQPDTPGSSGPP